MFVDQTVYHGRAEDTNRLDKELRCYDLLDRIALATTINRDPSHCLKDPAEWQG